MLTVLSTGCLDATQVTLELSTDAACADVAETAIAVGNQGSVDPTSPVAVTNACFDDGRIGSLVVLPTEDKSASWALEAVTTLGVPLEECVPPRYGPECIVARRALGFIEHTSLELPIAMRVACAGVVCPVDQTCIDGRCRPADCLDPSACDDPPPPFVVGLGGAGIDLPTDMAVGPDGNVYVTGSFQYDADFGGGTLVAHGGGDGFIASFSADGLHRWSEGFGSASMDIATSVSVSPDGIVHVLGIFHDIITVGSTTLTSRGSTDIVLAAYRRWGTPVWAVSIGEQGGDDANELAYASDGTAYLTATTSSGVTAAGATIAARGGTDAILARVTDAGTLAWAVVLGGPDNDVAGGAAVDGSGNVYVTGRHGPDADLGNGAPVGGNAQGDVFVVSVDASGQHRWAKSFGHSGADLGVDVAVAPSGEIAVSGQLSGPAEIDGVPIQALPRDGFVVMFDGSGALRWSRTFGSGNGASEVRRVAFDAAGTLYVAGTFFDTLALGAISLTGSGLQNPFVAALDTTGAVLWARGFDAPQYANVGGVAPAGDGAAFVTGHYNPQLFAGDDALTSNGADDVFLFRLLPP